MERSPVSNYSISKRIMHLKIGNVSLKKKNSKYQPFKRTPKNICLLVILSTPCISTCWYTGLAKNKTKQNKTPKYTHSPQKIEKY